jgi:hypothetical protein
MQFWASRRTPRTRKFDSQLSDDVIQIHLLPHADAVQAERDALTLMKNQVTNMPAGADKFEKLAAIKRAEKRLAKTDRWLPKQLHEAARGLHKYLTLARMGERLIRTISLVSNLETEAARYGLDLTKLDEAQELHKLPAAVIETAVDRALSDTYASRPDPATDLGRAYKNYATSNNPGWILSSAVFPFVGYMGNYARMVFDYSPLPLIKAALVGAGESGPTVENHLLHQFFKVSFLVHAVIVQRMAVRFQFPAPVPIPQGLGRHAQKFRRFQDFKIAFHCQLTL